MSIGLGISSARSRGSDGRCGRCEAPGGVDCRGQQLHHACERADYRELFRRLATGEHPEPTPPEPSPGDGGDRARAADVLRSLGVPEEVIARLAAGGRLADDDRRRMAEAAADRAGVVASASASTSSSASASVPPGPSYAELRANMLACPFNAPVPPAERAGCGCTRRCTRVPTLGDQPGGGTTLTNCWFDCPIAPRRANG